MSPALAGRFFTTELLGEPYRFFNEEGRRPQSSAIKSRVRHGLMVQWFHSPSEGQAHSAQTTGPQIGRQGHN